MKKILFMIGLSLVSVGSLFSQTKIYNLPTNIGSTWDFLPTTQGVNTVKINPANLWLGIPFAIKDEGINLVGSGPTSINFTGAGVTATQTSNAITVNIPAASGGGTSIETAAPIASSGTVPLTFDVVRYFQKTTQTGDITFSASSGGNLNGRTQVVDIDGNSTNTVTFPSTWTNSNGLTFDNTKNNVIYLDYVNGKVKYNIIKEALPAAADVTAPTYTVQTVTGVGPTSATYNVQINEAGQVRWMITTSATAPSTTAIDAGTGAVGSNFGTLTMVGGATNSTATISGLTASTSYYLWSYARDGVPNSTAVQSGINFTTTAGGDVVAPTYSVKTVTSVTAFAGTFNVQINEAGQVRWMVTTSSTAPTKAAILAGTGAVNGNFGSATMVANTTNSILLAGLNASTSYYLWSYAEDLVPNQTAIQASINFTTSAFSNTNAVSGTATDRVLVSANQPAGWGFGTNGTDSPFSVSMYSKRLADGSQYLFELGDGTSNPMTLIHNGNQIQFYLVGTPGNYLSIGSPFTYGTNTIIQVTITYDGSKTIGGLKMYINGASVSTFNYSAGTYDGLRTLSSTTRLAIAGYSNLSNFGAVAVDDFALWNKELSAAEVLDIAVADKNLTTATAASNLKSWYRFENSGVDSGINKHNLTSTTTPVYVTKLP